jgi:hypothetical protein
MRRFRSSNISRPKTNCYHGLSTASDHPPVRDVPRLAMPSGPRNKSAQSSCALRLAPIHHKDEYAW